jgi:hypothetical protein
VSYYSVKTVSVSGHAVGDILEIVKQGKPVFQFTATVLPATAAGKVGLKFGGSSPTTTLSQQMRPYEAQGQPELEGIFLEILDATASGSIEFLISPPNAAQLQAAP